jgi:hypothetical protein
MPQLRQRFKGRPVERLQKLGTALADVLHDFGVRSPRRTPIKTHR